MEGNLSSGLCHNKEIDLCIVCFMDKRGYLQGLKVLTFRHTKGKSPFDTLEYLSRMCDATFIVRLKITGQKILAGLLIT
jgi:hypothetical protein